MRPQLAASWLFLGYLIQLVTAATAGVGTCSETEKCHTGCCAKSGSCGFGPEFCGNDVCISSCDAVAECGEYADVKGKKCPLNVCCSKFGYCGTSEEFCGGGCQSGCDAPKEPSCDGNSSQAVYLGYYESWNYEKACDNLLPQNINVSPWTHLYYSFAGIAADFTITSTHSNDEEYWPKFTALKKKKSSLKAYISVGGWDLGGKVISDMVSSAGNRKSFIDSSVEFMKKYGFDGMDIDWEYPVAAERGGSPDDTKNFVTFLSELRDAFGKDYGITCTLPSSYWYLRHFDITNMEKYVDYFNFMSYDIHGTWDGDSQWTSSVINPHTNLTEISTGLDLLWRCNIPPGKVLLGLGFYGRSFTLADPSCSTPGCAFYKGNNNTGRGVPGECTGTAGLLSDYEISHIIQDYSINVHYDEAAAVNWMTWSSNQWVSFDNGRTLKQKADFANSRCLGGLFGWAVDLGGPGSLTNPNSLNASDTSLEGANLQGGSDGTVVLYAGQEVFSSHSVTGVAPLSVIFPQSVLPSPTVIDVGGYPTSLEMAWNTTATVTSGSITTVTTTITRTIVETTIPIPAITTGTINYHNWNISAGVTWQAEPLIPSVSIPPATVTNNSTLLNQTGIYHSPSGTRTVIIPPWPWTTDSSSFPTVTFTQGDTPGPTCTANCGQKCQTFCHGPCLVDCTSSGGVSSGFIDPSDPDPPSHSKCSGSGCVNGECTTDLCVQKGCLGDDCQNGVCVGEKCSPTSCTGTDCDDGHCNGDDCQNHGCVGSDCDSGGSGQCLGPSCISWGCLGTDCSTTDSVCTGPSCRIVSCSGVGCSNGICSGDGCQSEDNDCEADRADKCTEYISSSLVTPASTYTTSTVTSHCQTITACSAKPTTTTSTISKDGLNEGTILNIESSVSLPEAEINSSLDAQYSSMVSALNAPTTTSTSTTESKTSTTTTAASKPSETGYSCKGSPRCKTFAHLHSFCDMAKSFLHDNTIYGTTDRSQGYGPCYTDGKNLEFGCGVFVKGDNCEMKGAEMAATYDHIFQASEGACKICGQAFFANGCELQVDYQTLATATKLHHPLKPTGTNSANWAGAVLQQPPPNTTYTYIAATITVPTPTPITSSSSSYQAASAWVGLDGATNTNSMLQTGINFYTFNNKTYIDPWYEWYRGYALDYDELAINPGDVIIASVNATSSRTGICMIENLTTGEKGFQSVTASKSTATLQGRNAEWVVEDFREDGELVSFPGFGEVKFEGCVVGMEGAGKKTKECGVENATLYDLVQDQQVLARSEIMDASTLLVFHG